MDEWLNDHSCKNLDMAELLDDYSTNCPVGVLTNRIQGALACFYETTMGDQHIRKPTSAG